MSGPFGRYALVGLAFGATAGLGLIGFVVYRELSRRRRVVLEIRSAARLFSTDEAARFQDTLDAHEVEAQQQALAAVEAVVQGLSPEQQLELRNQLDQVLSCMASLRSEVAELRGGLHDIALQIIQDVKYSTAYAESDYTDRDTDKEDKEELEQESEEQEEEDRSCATVLTLCQEDSPKEDKEEEEEGRLQLGTEVPNGELALLLAQSDILHTGDASLKAEGFRLLLKNRAEYGDDREFLWRLARAYVDMYEYAEDKQEKMSYALKGREEAEGALQKNSLNAECHKWFAVLSGLVLLHESTHSKLKSSRILKEHVDRALALRDDDPMCYYLLGRWCYEVATLDWLERKAATALYRSLPTCTLHTALENFLKVEELSPGFSRTVRLYIAKVLDSPPGKLSVGRRHLQAFSILRACKKERKTITNFRSLSALQPVPETHLAPVLPFQIRLVIFPVPPVYTVNKTTYLYSGSLSGFCLHSL
ncbi:regulator of microtubule dynamics protein 3 isoform X3 [Kryptolebias marmoratus]|uniref:regulator of microtubule dynamics protein 3 isoform X3 n=1 Tax=Kryptolebias marmoratus TaxID=37003 RepID=UPI0018ACD635|nr:regulator of microtubule dynamics protein 3 isoform X3 [Kryptolebias marmoratus]